MENYNEKLVRLDGKAVKVMDVVEVVTSSDDFIEVEEKAKKELEELRKKEWYK